MDVRSYVDGYIRRERVRLEECEERRKQALQAAGVVAKSLAESGAKKVVLFGSLARGEGFGMHSDIDLAVAGICPSKYWSIWAMVNDLTDFPVDLIVLEQASSILVDRVKLEGVVLYGKGERQPTDAFEG